MKKLLLLSALMLAVSSCYKDHSIDGGNDGDNTKPSTDFMKHLPTDQSRIIRYNGADVNNIASATRAVTRANEDKAHPYVAAPDLATVNAQELTSDKMNDVSNGGVWKISNNSTNKNIWINNVNAPIEIYVEASDVFIGLNSANSNYSTIYVLPEAKNFSLNSGTIQSGWTLKLWSNLELNGSALSMYPNSKFYYYGADELKIGGCWQSADRQNVWFESHGPVRFTNNVEINAKDNTFWFGGETYFEGKFRTDNNYNYFTFAGPVEFNGPAGANSWDTSTYITRGNFDFQNSVKFNDLYITNDAVDMTFNQCATIRNFGMGGGNTRVTLDINYFIEFPDGMNFENGSVAKFLLDDAVMIIGGEADRNLAGRNVFVNEHYVEAKGSSAIYIQGSVTGVELSQGDGIFTYFRTESDKDRLGVFGKRYRNESGELVTEEPVIYVGWASNADSYKNSGYNTKFNFTNVSAEPTTLDWKTDDGEDDNFVIEGGEYDCRADYTWGTQPPTQDEILPPAEHKYSATGLAFDGNYVYICWHSNLPGGETQDGEEHDHGTNMDPDNDSDSYGGPSVDDNEDWGGIIDIVRIDNYHPDNAELYIASTVWNPEHKYNHVKFYDSKLYLASTSWNVGAALHVVPIISSTEGVGLGFDSENSYRVNLTGKSANCVEIVDNKSIVTISGRSIGGLNWFSLTDESNQSRLYKNSNTENYGGKFIYDDGNGKIYAFHNTDAATITTYDYNGNQVGGDWVLTDNNGSTISLVPYDGKNTIMVKNGKLYACCGRNGLYVFDTNSHSMVGRSKLSANCVDVDDSGYIYVATGGGLAVFNNDNLQADTKEFNTINYVAYTGKGFKYPNGWEKDGTMPDGTAKQSSNFVRVVGGKVFIAYGMYGLRIYTVSELLNPKN